MKTKTLTDYKSYLDQQMLVSKYGSFDRFDDIAKQLISKYKLTNESYILDIGCRRGVGVYNLVNAGYNNVYGCDIGNEMIKLFGNDHFAQCDMHDELGFNYKFDLISIIHTLEHAYNIPKVLANIKNQLNDDGILYIVIPKGEFENFAHYVDIQSLEEFYPALEEAGFEIVLSEITRNGTEFNYHCKNKL
jgi:SAM-dependent methyltransferase